MTTSERSIRWWADWELINLGGNDPQKERANDNIKLIRSTTARLKLLPDGSKKQQTTASLREEQTFFSKAVFPPDTPFLPTAPTTSLFSPSLHFQAKHAGRDWIKLKIVYMTIPKLDACNL